MMMDWARARADLLAVRDDNAVSVAIRRGATTLPAQTIRIAQRGGSRPAATNGAERVAGGVLILGDTDLDIQPGDRLNANGLLYEVIAVRPNRRAATAAEAAQVS